MRREMKQQARIEGLGHLYSVFLHRMRHVEVFEIRSKVDRGSNQLTHATHLPTGLVITEPCYDIMH